MPIVDMTIADLPINPSVYHAVYIPKDDAQPVYENLSNQQEQALHIYTDKIEALKLIKQYKKSRLKSFKNLEEACEFAKNGLETNVFSSSFTNERSNALPEEKISFKAPKPQNLTQFRKTIERGDIQKVKETIWGNPRYLVSSGDTPAILQEGCRYNALHVAVKCTPSPQNVEMVELILNTVGDYRFIELIYGEETYKTYVNRANILREMYLNTPDKGLNETPLHFATKFGLKDVVRILVSYPECLKTSLNKYQKAPADVICSRKCMDDKRLMKEIRALLEEQYYVPVLRAHDNSLQPRIGDPFSPTSPPELKSDLLSPQIEVKAVAGPMSKSQAVEFRKKWKTPPRSFGTPTKQTLSSDLSLLTDSPTNLSLRIKDPDKGLERVGRELATECQVEWKEYWSFLGQFVNLQSIDGLDKLEEYIRLKYESVHNVYTKAVDKVNKQIEQDISNICENFDNLIINGRDENAKEEFITPPSSPLNEDEFSDAIDNFEDEELNVDMFLEGKKPTKTDFAVLDAIPPHIDINRYPCIYKWRHEMILVTKPINLRSPKPLIKRKLFYNES